MQDDLAIPLFLFTCAVPFVIEAMKGIVWPWLKNMFPKLTQWVGVNAESPQSWLLIIVFALFAVAATGRKTRMASSPPADPPIEVPEWLPSVPDRLSALAED